ncbi:hypothetical protein JCM16303_004301 [Sporobolomyces ruberrimus]
MTKKEENAENICHWNKCLTQYPSAEELFNHVCSTHIGRKSAGTLSLECQWTGCQAKASKRDHLTSHCRVHIALKPHVCTVCTKAFKRPQDLKKHEKIHTEEHHANHRQAKAIIVPSKGSAPVSNTHKPSHSPQPPTFGFAPAQQDAKPQIHPQHAQPQQQQAPYPFSFPTIGYPYQYLPQGQANMAQQLGPNGMPQQSVDQLAQFIALQQQLNSQAQAAASQGFSLPGLVGGLPAGYPLQLGQNPYGVASAPGLSFIPQGVYPLGGHYAFSAPGQHQPQYAQVPVQPTPVSQPPQHRNSSIASLTSTPSQSSLYPSLSNNLFPSPAALPAIKAEDQPSPAQSYKSQYSSISSPSGVPALSPPSLSTPENSYSPTPDFESDSGSSRRAYHSGNTVAGKKRGFDEAAEHFLGDLKNKRFHNQDTVNDQLDALSTFLLSPEMTGPPALTPGRTTDDSSSSNGSDYGRQEGSFDREEVDTINQLLLSLGQSIDSDPHALQHSSSLDSDPYLFSHHPDQAHSFNSLAPIQHTSSSSMYPVLPSMTKNAPGQHFSYPSAYPSLPGQDSTNRHANLRLSKPPTAPSIAGDYRQTQYQHVARLQRAAPSESRRDEQDAMMEVDAEMAEAASALLMGKSYSAPSAPTSSPTSQRPKLPSLATAILGNYDGPRLAPIAGSPVSNPPTLPHIRDVISLSPRRASMTEAPDSPTSPSTSSNATSFASPVPPSATSRSMYPSLSSTPTSASSSSSRPVSAGGVERLTHRVHKMRLPSTSSEPSTDFHSTESGSTIDTMEELSASSDEDDEDHPNARFKKSRIMATPESMSELGEVEEADEGDEEDIKPVIPREDRTKEEQRIVDEQRRIAEKRRATIAYLVGYVNARYRETLAKRGVSDLRKAILKSNTSSSHKVEA